jgi:hypothetical protein
VREGNALDGHTLRYGRRVKAEDSADGTGSASCIVAADDAGSTAYVVAKRAPTAVAEAAGTACP